jgi:hypothetical protein
MTMLLWTISDSMDGCRGVTEGMVRRGVEDGVVGLPLRQFTYWLFDYAR